MIWVRGGGVQLKPGAQLRLLEYSLSLMQPNESSNFQSQDGQLYSVPNSQPTPTHREGLSSIMSTIAVLLIAPVMALFLTAFIFQSYQVEGSSMETTLYHNDRLLVWKVPKTWSRITGHPYIPKRGDVVVFVERELDSFGQDPGKQLIKRVIALPGERIVIKDGIATVYNKEYPGGFQPDKLLPYGSVVKETTISVDVTVPKGTMFVMGDNRGNSLDSRTFGPVAAQDIIGKLLVRVWPLGAIKNF